MSSLPLTGPVTNSKNDVLAIENSNSGVDGTVRYIKSGNGTASILGIATNAVNVDGAFNATTLSIGTYAFTRTGAHTLNITTTGTTSVTLPTSGTLITTASTSIPALASVGTITSGTWNATVVAGTYGGTGVNNGASTITIGANVTLSGAYTFTGTLTATTAVTFPTSGTLSTLAGAETLTNKTLTTPKIASILTNSGAATITLPTTTGTLATLAVAETLSNKTLTTPVINGTITGTTVIPVANGGTGVTSSVALVQRLHTRGTPTSGTTTTPFDNTVPQITEGIQVLSQAITPKNSSNRLEIEVMVNVSSNVAQEFTVAIFQDSTAGALEYTCSYGTATQNVQIPLKLEMAAGTTSATTFKVRVGGNNAGTTTFMGNGGASLYSTGACSYINIKEYSA